MSLVYENALQDLAQVRQERDAARAQVAALREALETWAWAHHDPRWSEDDARRAKALRRTVTALASTAASPVSSDSTPAPRLVASAWASCAPGAEW